MPSVGNWHDSATEAYRSRCAQVMSERRTVARACSSSLAWSPTTQDAENNGSGSQQERNTPPLNAQVMVWTTPTAVMGESKHASSIRGKNAQGGPSLGEAVNNWATPCSRDEKGPTGIPTKGGRNLPREVRTWPTVTTTGSRRNTLRTEEWTSNPETLMDALVVEELWPTITATPYGSTNNGNPHDGRESYATKGTPSLWTHAKSAGGVLNADWVEMLMGFPPGWTSEITPTQDEDEMERKAIERAELRELPDSDTIATEPATDAGQPAEERSSTKASRRGHSRSKSQATGVASGVSATRSSRSARK